jgi:hypothetical protein
MGLLSQEILPLGGISCFAIAAIREIITLLYAILQICCLVKEKNLHNPYLNPLA